MINQTVEGYSIPIRLDRYLRTMNPSLTQGVIEQYLRKALINVNGKKAKSNLRISDGDIVSLPDNIMPSSETNREYSPNSTLLAEKLLSEYLLYDHPAFYAFYKPSGLASQGGSGIAVSIDDALQSMGLRLVHRLDKDTSGIMIAAKTRDDAIKLTEAFRNHKIYKTYYACVSKRPKQSEGKITSYLTRQNNAAGASHKWEVEGSKIAITEYEIVGSNDAAILVKFTPTTGRMHQLRLHAKDLGCPIIGDKKYGGAENEHLMLHASQIILDKFIFGAEIIITARMPEYFMVK